MPLKIPYYKMPGPKMLKRSFQEYELAPQVTSASNTSSIALTTVEQTLKSSTVGVPGGAFLIITGMADASIINGTKADFSLHVTYPSGTTETLSPLVEFDVDAGSDIRASCCHTWFPDAKVGKHVFEFRGVRGSSGGGATVFGATLSVGVF